jgi:hypothetical protein
MALEFKLYLSMLDEQYVLLPERYDPRKKKHVSGIPLLDIVYIGEKVIKNSNYKKSDYLLLDTSNSHNGFIEISNNDYNKPFGSNKKIISKNSVIISRLRPYLRQIGFVDNNIVSENYLLLASTEYFELISKTDESIAFLLPFLLSKQIQEYLQISVEGGNHPRFKINTLTNLYVPYEIVDNRNKISRQIIDNINNIRTSYLFLNETYTLFSNVYCA